MNLDKKNYNPETYWSEVAGRMGSRKKDGEIIAGDDEPFYRYKRAKFLEMLNGVPVSGKKVLEVGSGPGGNLLNLSNKNKDVELFGADISQNMVALATENLPDDVKIVKINGKVLPFEDNSLDIVFTATVLQHNTDEVMLKNIMKEICRVSGKDVYLFERTENTITGDELCLGRPVSYFEKIMNDNGFELADHKYINVRASYYLAGITRKLLNPKTRQEGEPLNAFSTSVQNVFLPLTKVLDNVFQSKKDLCKMHFRKKG